MAVSTPSIWSNIGPGALAAFASSRVRRHVSRISASRLSASCKRVARWVSTFSQAVDRSCRRCHICCCAWSTSSVGWSAKILAMPARSRSICVRSSGRCFRIASISALGPSGPVKARSRSGTSAARVATWATGIAAGVGGAGAVAGGAWTVVVASPTKGGPSKASIESSGQTRWALVRRSLPGCGDRALRRNVLRFGSIARPPSVPVRCPGRARRSDDPPKIPCRRNGSKLDTRSTRRASPTGPAAHASRPRMSGPSSQSVRRAVYGTLVSLAHHSGNPFMRYIAPMSWPAVVIEPNHFSKIGATSPDRYRLARARLTDSRKAASPRRSIKPYGS